METLGREIGPAYARWCDAPGNEQALTALRQATASDLAFGSDAFKERIEGSTARATTQRRRRPREGSLTSASAGGPAATLRGLVDAKMTALTPG